jgi:hypothetical protein
MSTDRTYDGFRLHSLRVALHLTQPQATAACVGPLASASPSDWLERLANWAERQPMYHRMGSYTRR